MFSKIRELKLPRWGRTAKGVALAAALLLPGVLFLRPDGDPAPDSEAPATREREQSTPLPAPTATPEPIAAPEPGAWELAASVQDTGEDDVAGTEPIPTPAAPQPPAPPATELLAIETSSEADGARAIIHLRANGTIADADVIAIDGPDRLVIDLPDLSSAMESSRSSVDSDRVARVRIGQHDDLLRVVLDAASDGEGFEDRIVEPTPDGLRVILGTPPELAEAAPATEPSPLEDSNGWDAAPVAASPEFQPVASIAPPESSEQSLPGQEGNPLPLYLMGDEASDRRAASSPALEERYDCIIEPFELVEVGSALTAVVDSVDVERSDFVEEGQVLAQLQSSPERATVAVADARARMRGDLLARRARMELGTRKQKRAEQLFESEALSADMRDEIRTEAEVAKAVVQEAREHKELMELERREAVERLNEHTITSPVTGVVVDRLKSSGEVVKEETILVIAQIDPLRVEVILPAAAFGAIQSGMRAEVIPELPDAGVQMASVKLVDRVVDGTSGTFGVRLELPNADHAVPSGLRCQVRFLQVD